MRPARERYGTVRCARVFGAGAPFAVVRRAGVHFLQCVSLEFVECVTQRIVRRTN